MAGEGGRSKSHTLIPQDMVQFGGARPTFTGSLESRAVWNVLRPHVCAHGEHQGHQSLL